MGVAMMTVMQAISNVNILAIITEMILGLSQFRHFSVWFGSGNKTFFFQFSFILCYKIE